MVGCVLSQLKPSRFSIVSCERGRGLRPRLFSQLLGLYPILKADAFCLFFFQLKLGSLKTFLGRYIV